jgi:nicotinate-nucleotide pyrophosphorylase (carboxylating)
MNHIQLESMLKNFFIEDIGSGDISGDAIFTDDERGSYSFLAKEDGVFCGSEVIRAGFHLMDPTAEIIVYRKDGERVEKGEMIAELKGTMRGLLKAERVILNLIQRMSGIATQTAKAVEIVRGTGANICDTRKTTPGLRMFEKYAVRIGGGYNHRMGLYDAIMLKDNHIAFAGGILSAMKKAKRFAGHTIKVEVEVETKEQLEEAVKAGADIIMFDNCQPEQIREWISYVPDHICTEASGGITLSNLRAYAETGVQWISLGFLTHSYQVLDISAKVRPSFKNGLGGMENEIVTNPSANNGHSETI